MKLDELQNGKKLFQKRARKILPYLVRQAKAGQKIFYSDLAKEVGMSNPRNLNYVLGLIGDTLIELNKKEKRKIPPIQCLVVNKNTELPSNGVYYYVAKEKRITIERFKLYSTKEKERIIDILLSDIYSYKYWDSLLTKLKMKPVKFNIYDLIQKAKHHQFRGESIHHKKFKLFIASNPQKIGLKNIVGKAQVEYKLPSADKIDVVFNMKDFKVGVEVKSFVSNADDILRGLFQCIKYKYLIEADQATNNEIPSCRVVLALQSKLPTELLPIKNILGVEVIDNIKIR